MGRISKLEIQIEDLDWFAVDSRGEVAHFTSGAYGSFPDSLTPSRDILNALEEFFIENLKISTTSTLDSEAFNRVRLTSDTPEVRNTVFAENLEISSKGLYSYDSYDISVNSGDYFRVSIPKNPIKIQDLPSEIQFVLRDIVLKDRIFNQDIFVREKSVLQCKIQEKNIRV